MSDHVKPHLWADAARGHLSRARGRRMEDHAAGCARCRQARARVLSAMDAFLPMREIEAPPLRWDHIGARIHWVTSSERRKAMARSGGTRTGRTRVRWAGAAFVVAAAAAMLLYVTRDEPGADKARRHQIDGNEAAAVESAASRAPSRVAPSALPALQPGQAVQPLFGLVTFLQGDVRVAEAAMGFDDLVVQGQRITTAAGSKVSVQFDRDSGFALAENSWLEVRAFDEQRVELVVDGRVFVDIERRRPEQTFVVVAGEREVHVRGTSFVVEHRGEKVQVACGHGEVMVLDDSGDEFAIAAGQVLSWDGRVQRAATLDLSAIAGLQRQVVRVPAWAGAGALRKTSSALAVSASPRQTVDIDGEPAGSGSFVVRVMSGRHHIQAEGVPGKWVELAPGASVNTPLQRPAQTSAAGTRKRRSELVAATRTNPRMHGCVRALDKEGILQGAYIVLDIGILRDGKVAHLNIVDTNLGRATARCVRDSVDRIEFLPGPAATFQQRIAW